MARLKRSVRRRPARCGRRFGRDDSCPVEVRSLGRTIVRWKHQIVAWHQALVSNGPTEAVNNLITRIKLISVNRPSMPGLAGSARAWSGLTTLVRERA